MITVLHKSPQQFASRTDFDAWAKEQPPGKTIAFVDGLPEAITPRMVVTLDSTTTTAGTAPPETKRATTDTAERDRLDVEVLAALREVMKHGINPTAGNLAEKIGADRVTVSASLQRLKAKGSVSKADGKHWQAPHAPEVLA